MQCKHKFTGYHSLPLKVNTFKSDAHIRYWNTSCCTTMTADLSSLSQTFNTAKNQGEKRKDNQQNTCIYFILIKTFTKSSHSGIKSVRNGTKKKTVGKSTCYMMHGHVYKLGVKTHGRFIPDWAKGWNKLREQTPTQSIFVILLEDLFIVISQTRSTILLINHQPLKKPHHFHWKIHITFTVTLIESQGQWHRYQSVEFRTVCHYIKFGRNQFVNFHKQANVTGISLSKSCKALFQCLFVS